MKGNTIQMQDFSPKNLSPTLKKFLATALNAVHCIKSDLQVQCCLQGLVKRYVLTARHYSFTLSREDCFWEILKRVFGLKK